mgnify:CR=1 FL=1
MIPQIDKISCKSDVVCYLKQVLVSMHVFVLKPEEEPCEENNKRKSPRLDQLTYDSAVASGESGYFLLHGG